MILGALVALSCGGDSEGGEGPSAQQPAGGGIAATAGGGENQSRSGAKASAGVGGAAKAADGGAAEAADGGAAIHEPVSEGQPVADWPPHQLADFDRCGDADLTGLAAACSESAGTHEIVANGGNLVEATASLIELTGASVTTRASVRFTPNVSQAFGIYLGTPNVPFSISTPKLQVMPHCSRYLAPELSQRLSGAACSQLRGSYLVQLTAGQTYTLSFGPITSRQWVRIYVEAISP